MEFNSELPPMMDSIGTADPRRESAIYQNTRSKVYLGDMHQNEYCSDNLSFFNTVSIFIFKKSIYLDSKSIVTIEKYLERLEWPAIFSLFNF